jgi:hypothetical protein
MTTPTDRAAWCAREQVANLLAAETQRHARDLAARVDHAQTGNPGQVRADAARILAALPADRDASRHRAELIHELETRH